MNKKFDLLVFIGRFQPWHNGHQKVLDAALEQSHKVLILVGSHDEPRTLRNPFSSFERKELIKSCLDYDSSKRVEFDTIDDILYNDDLWIKQVHKKIQHHYPFSIKAYPNKVGLIGHKKDHSSYYLSLFPGLESVDVENTDLLSSTDIRDLFYKDLPSFALEKVPKNCVSSLQKLIYSDNFKKLKDEYEFIRAYKKSWNCTPYPVTFVCSDAVVVQSGHILLIKRRANPGKGLWALPGGFVNQDETVKDAAIRELKEETKIDVPIPVLNGSISGSQVFDNPHRSARGRTITHAFHIELKPTTSLPKIKGSDDAEKASWVKLSDIKREMLFDDHFHIISHFIGNI